MEFKGQFVGYQTIKSKKSDKKYVTVNLVGKGSNFTKGLDVYQVNCSTDYFNNRVNVNYLDLEKYLNKECVGYLGFDQDSKHWYISKLEFNK